MGASTQDCNKSEEDSTTDGEILDPIESREAYVRLQVADLIAPSTMGKTSLTLGTALLPELPPAVLVGKTWNPN